MAGADGYTMADSCKIHEKVNSQIYTGLVAFVMGIVAMVRMTRNLPKKLTDANFYSNSVYSADTMFKGQVPSDQLPAPTLSAAEFMTVMKRMAELEEKMLTMNKPITLPPEKEEMLNAALSRADKLEQELKVTKKALEESVARTEELSAYIEKKKKKKLFAW